MKGRGILILAVAMVLAFASQANAHIELNVCTYNQPGKICFKGDVVNYMYQPAYEKVIDSNNGLMLEVYGAPDYSTIPFSTCYDLPSAPTTTVKAVACVS